MKTHNNITIRCQCKGSTFHGHCKHEDALVILLGKSTKLPRVVEHINGEILVLSFGSSSKDKDYLISMELKGAGIMDGELDIKVK
jgi:hypothetical protein